MSFPSSRADAKTHHASQSQRAARAAILGILLLTGTAHSAFGQNLVNREHTIKAAYLYNLSRYVTWPDSAFRDRQAPFVIGVVEPDFVSQDLQKIADLKTIDGRPIQIRKYSRPEDADRCHILFLPKGVDPEVEQLLVYRLKGSHVLLVGESEEFLDHGGAIAFVVRNNNVQLVIALEAAQREDLQISSKLLQVAHTLNY